MNVTNLQQRSDHGERKYEKKKARHAQLAELLSTYSQQYYDQDESTINDATYDELYQELLHLEKEYPEFALFSPSQKVGAKASPKFKKIPHSVQMLSLDNAYGEEDIAAFLERVKKLLPPSGKIELMLEPKFDGLSASLTYRNGILVTAATRGDGFVGEDVTKNMLTLECVPKKIPSPHTPTQMEVRGEVMMLKSDFFALNAQREKNGEKLFTNPRNAASGSLRQLDSEITKTRNLTFFAYAIISDDINLSSQKEVLNLLLQFGFLVSDKVHLCSTQEEAFAFYKKIEKQRAELPYDIDGIVYKLNDLNLQKQLGASAKFPRHSIAYKFPAQQAQTTVLDIVVQVGRTGNITPVAELKPVTVGGVVISRATLHNKDEIEKLDIRIGDRVVVQRAGDVIPKIVYPLLDERPVHATPFTFPTHCPCCGSALVREETEVAIKCLNFNCSAQLVERLIHFASKLAFNIDGLGEQNIRFFFESGIIKTPTDIFELEIRNDQLQLQNSEGWGRQSVKNLFSSINQARTIPLDRFIYALGIPQVGRSISKLMANFFVSYGNFINHIKNHRLDSLLSVAGIGNSIGNDIKNFFNNQQNMNVMEKLAGDGVSSGMVNVVDVGGTRSGLLTNKTIVFTGTFETISREEAKELAEKHGARAASSVSSKTSLVVAGENAGQKLHQAQKFGITVISEHDFLKMIQQ
ncbi:MAG: NAD-dependent DNA ligase LigA [Holosporaceae bacterium]|jgi:DNA ligase (NAD+)|nr:NAD-dependent DNA ligase LigA [Holosporaceae bacterium]